MQSREGRQMRALRVVGLDEDGKFVVCEDSEQGERFRIPADERLRAAARGDTTRLGQIETEVESQMRPREIQARIRAGESIEQVAQSAGMLAQRVERFAYPVLLERSRTAELAQRAHPIREDGPDVQTLTEVAAHSFGLRGQDYAAAHWDSWRGEDNRWVVQLRWQTGRSENRAHWVFSPGAHGGTVTPLDDMATELIDPNPKRPLRTVQNKEQLPPAPPAKAEPEPEILAQEPEPPAVEPQVKREQVKRQPQVKRVKEPVPLERKPAPAAKRGKKNHPIVPSWEDVLLGVRSNRG